jgi:hypothetical protein
VERYSVLIDELLNLGGKAVAYVSFKIEILGVELGSFEGSL